ncbi:MAG TPA: DUF5985 family protein [Bryobacteraceae bacterium]|jgi:uncharacterized membrane protein HdeD (DUF308 family)|nr:DUF5985 family protein [Bryobacteraceae bacterium]
MSILFLLGFISAMSLAAGVFFLRSWNDSRDFLFLAFAIFFFVEAAESAIRTGMDRPAEGAPWMYVARLMTSVLLAVGIIRKNFVRRR